MGSTLRLLILLFLTVFNVAETKAQSKTSADSTQKKKLSKEERLAKKHANWDSCFIVKAEGDTIYGKVDHRYDQSTLLSSYISDMLIFFAHPDGKEEQFIPNDLKELYVYNLADGFKKYVVLDDEYYLSNYGILYRVLVDGPCKLVADRVKSTLPISVASAFQEAHYYILYKKKFTPIKIAFSDGGANSGTINIAPGFIKKCAKAFAECPALVEQIENKTFRSGDIREIVKEFNNCISVK